MQRRDGFAASRAWQPDVRVAVELLPLFDDSHGAGGHLDKDWVGQNCGVCGRSGHPANGTVRLSGPVYDAAGLLAPAGGAATSGPWWPACVPSGDLAVYAVSFPAGRFW